MNAKRHIITKGVTIEELEAIHECLAWVINSKANKRPELKVASMAIRASGRLKIEKIAQMQYSQEQSLKDKEKYKIASGDM